MKSIWIRDNPFNDIIRGHKTIEGRLNKGIFKKIEHNEVILLCTKTQNCKVKIIKIDQFNNFKDMLVDNNLKKTLPNIDSVKNGVIHYNKIYSEKNILKYGVLGLHMMLI